MKRKSINTTGPAVSLSHLGTTKYIRTEPIAEKKVPKAQSSCLPNFLTSLGTLFYTDTLDKKSMKIACLLHYLLNNVIVVGCGIWFGWIDADNRLQIIGMIVLVALVFAVVSILSWKKAEKDANLMNERLAQYQEKREAD